MSERISDTSPSFDVRFSATFYKALDCQSGGVRDYKRAFKQAIQPARMRSSEPTSSQARKPAKHQAPGAVDFICLLSKDGDVFPEPSKEAAKRLDAGPNKMESKSSTLSPDSLECVFEDV